MANPGSNEQASSTGVPDHEWLMVKGEMGRRIAEFPWQNTPLGPLDRWPDHLQTATNLVLEAAAPMALIWGKEFHFLYNDGYAKIIRDKHPHALGARAHEIFPESWGELRPLFEQVSRGEAIMAENYELLVTHQGVTKPSYFSFSYNPIRRKKGPVDGFVAVVLETTARVIQEQERAQVFETVLSAINDFAYTFDREGRFIYINKALLDLWGLKLEQAVGKNFFDLKYPGDLAERLQRQIQQVIAERKIVRDETRYVSPTGVEGYYEYIFSPVFAADGTVMTVAGSTRDITSRKKLELEAHAASKAKDDFLATLSHELRTPLNPVLLLATEAAKNLQLPAEIRADFKSIADNITLEARLIDDLLDISRITHDKLPLHLQPFEIHPLLLRVIESVDAELVAKSLVLKKKFEATSDVVIGDAVRLHQVFSNLLRNAVKFTPRDGHISLTTRTHPGRAHVMLVEVSDSGIGLTVDELGKVFNPFAQGDHVESGPGEFGGLGLGLAISRKIAELHGGAISARSAGRNQGASFLVELPLEPSGKSTSPFLDDQPLASRSRTVVGFKVLLVEDHKPSRDILSRLLVNRQIEVISAASAHEAIAKAKEHRFDLVISDLGLPDMTGYELMTFLKSSYRCRGIALSGYGTQEDVNRSKEVGFAFHLTKPVQARELDEALSKLIAD